MDGRETPEVTPVTPYGSVSPMNGREGETATGKRPHEESPGAQALQETASLQPSPKKIKAPDGSPVGLYTRLSSLAGGTRASQTHSSGGLTPTGALVRDTGDSAVASAVASAASAAQRATAFSQALSLASAGQIGTSPAAVALSPQVPTTPGVTYTHATPGVTYAPAPSGVPYTHVTPRVPYAQVTPGVAYTHVTPGVPFTHVTPGGAEGESGRGVPRRAAAEAVAAARAVAEEEKRRQLEERAKAMAALRAEREREKAEKKRLAQEAREAEKAKKQREREEAKKLREAEKERKKEEARIAREAAAKERARIKEEEKRAKALRMEEEKRKRLEEKAKRLEEEKRAKEERKAAKIAEKKRIQEEAEKAKLAAARAAEEQQKKQWNSWGFGSRPQPEKLPPLEASDAVLADSPVKAIVLQRHITGATVRAKLSLKDIDKTAFEAALRDGADVVEEFRDKRRQLRAARAKQSRKGSPVSSMPNLSCMKLLAFHENTRPPYYGTVSKAPEGLRVRNPFARASELDYEADSEDEWEEDAEDIEKSDGEEDIEEEDEEGDFIVPDDYLSDDERENCDMDGTVPSKSDPVKKRASAGAPQAIVDGIHFSLPDDSPLKAYAVTLLPHVDIPSPSPAKSPAAAAKELPQEQLRHLASILHNSVLSRPALIAAFHQKYPAVKKQVLKRAIMAISTRASSRAKIQVNQDILAELGLAVEDQDASPQKKNGPSIEEAIAVKKTIAKSSPAKRTKQSHLLPMQKDSPTQQQQQAQLVIVLDEDSTPAPAAVSAVEQSKTAIESKAVASGAVGLSASPVNVLVPKKKAKKRVTPTAVPPPAAGAPKESPTITSFFGKPSGN